MPSVLEKWSIQYLIDNCPPELVALSVVAILVAWLTYRVNMWLSGGINTQERLEIVEKQQHKLEQLSCSMPCVPKRSATWLTDPAQNGGQPPELPVCEFAELKKRKDRGEL